MWSINIKSLHIFLENMKRQRFYLEIANMNTHDWTGSVCLRNVRSLKSMLSRWLIVPTGSAIVSPSYSRFKRNSERLFHNEQCSGKHCRKWAVAHVPRWKCFTIPAITITAAKYYTPVRVCVCLQGGRPLYGFTDSAIHIVPCWAPCDAIYHSCSREQAKYCSCC